MKTFIKYLFFGLIALIALFQKVYSEEKIKIGLIIPLSGEYKEIGESIL